MIGDTKIILPDGARVQTNMVALIGDRKEVVVEPIPGGPIIQINSYSVIGDTKVFSLSAVPKGKLRKLWTSFRAGAGKTLPPSSI